MSKTQRDTSNKAKMIGKIVVDQEGNLVGTVKDVGFEAGKSGITLSVEDKDGQFQDISWESIQGAADFVVLKPPQQASSPQVVQPGSNQPTQTMFNQPKWCNQRNNNTLKQLNRCAQFVEVHLRGFPNTNDGIVTKTRNTRSANLLSSISF